MGNTTSEIQDETKTTNGASPKGENVLQENTDETKNLVCRRHPDRPDLWLCQEVEGQRKQKTVSTSNPPPGNSASPASGEKSSRNSDAEQIETWSRDNGETISVQRMEHRGRVVYVPVEILKPQSAGRQPSVQPEEPQDSQVARARLRLFGRKNTKSCPLPRTRPSTHTREDEQTRGGT